MPTTIAPRMENATCQAPDGMVKLGQPERRVVAGERGGGEQECDSNPDPRRADEREGDLAGDQRRGASDNSDKDGTDGASVAVVGPHAGRKSCKEGEGVDREREKSEQRKPMAATPRMMPMMIMVVGSVTKGQTVAPSTTTTTQAKYTSNSGSTARQF